MKPKTEKKNAWVYVKFAIIIVVSGIFGAVCNMAIGAEFEDFTNLSAVLSQSLYGAGVPLLGGGLMLAAAFIWRRKTPWPGPMRMMRHTKRQTVYSAFP